MPPIKYVYMQNFMFVGVSVIEILEFNQKMKKKKNMAKPYYKYYTGFTRFCKFFLNIISFQHVSHFGIGRCQIEWNMKVKIFISICTNLRFNAK